MMYPVVIMDPHVRKSLKRINRKVDALMSAFDELKAQINELKGTVGKIGVDTDGILEKLANPDITPEQLAEVIADLKVVNETAKAIDNKVADPVVEPPPVEEPAPPAE